MSGIPLRDLPEHTQRAVANALAKDKRKEIKQNASWLTKVEDMKAVLNAMQLNSPRTEIQLSVGKFVVVPRFKYGIRGWFVSPADERFVPCGFFTLHTLRSEIATREVIDA